MGSNHERVKSSIVTYWAHCFHSDTKRMVQLPTASPFIPPASPSGWTWCFVQRAAQLWSTPAPPTSRARPPLCPCWWKPSEHSWMKAEWVFWHTQTWLPTINICLEEIMTVIAPFSLSLSLSPRVSVIHQYKVNCDTVKTLPSVTFHLGGQEYSLTQEDYILWVSLMMNAESFHRKYAVVQTRTITLKNKTKKKPLVLSRVIHFLLLYASAPLYFTKIFPHASYSCSFSLMWFTTNHMIRLWNMMHYI